MTFVTMKPVIWGHETLITNYMWPQFIILISDVMFGATYGVFKMIKRLKSFIVILKFWISGLYPIERDHAQFSMKEKNKEQMMQFKNMWLSDQLQRPWGAEMGGATRHEQKTRRIWLFKISETSLDSCDLQATSLENILLNKAAWSFLRLCRADVCRSQSDAWWRMLSVAQAHQWVTRSSLKLYFGRIKIYWKYKKGHLKLLRGCPKARIWDVMGLYLISWRRSFTFLGWQHECRIVHQDFRATCFSSLRFSKKQNKNVEEAWAVFIPELLMSSYCCTYDVFAGRMESTLFPHSSSSSASFLPLSRCMMVFPRLRVTDLVQVTPVLPHGTFSAVTLNKPLVSLARTYWQSPRKE